MKCTLVMIQMCGKRWIDSIWIDAGSARERRDLIMGQFTAMGFEPAPNGTYSWCAQSTVEDAKAVLPETGTASAGKTKPEVNAK